MHHLKLKSAVAKYAPLHAAGATKEEIIVEIQHDEKEYAANEVEEIYAAIAGDSGATPSEQPKTEKKEKVKEAKPSTHVICQEWRMELVNGKLEKLKIVRDNVRLTERVFEEMERQKYSTLIAYIPKD